MCGIFGIFNLTKAKVDMDARLRAYIERILAVETMVALLPRGDDATGMAVLWDDKETAVVKQPVPSPVFALNDGDYKAYKNEKQPEASFKWLMSKWFRNIDSTQITQILGHVRKATTGSVYNNLNNHPIIATTELDRDGDIIKPNVVVGVHNGGISNHKELFKKFNLPQVGAVDSEVIFQFMASYGDKLDKESLEYIYKELVGALAVMAYRPDKPNTVFGLKNIQRPLIAGYIPALGAIVLVSKSEYFDTAVNVYERWKVREADTELTIETGNKEEIISYGSPYDACPYLDIQWASKEVPSGIFTISLDQEIDNKKIADMIETKFVATTTTSVVTHANSYYSTKDTKSNKSVKDSRAVTIQQNNKDAFEDYSEYEVVATEMPSGNTEEDIIDAEIIEEQETPAEDYDIPEALNENVPYSWDELLAIGTDLLHKDDIVANPNLLLNKNTTELLKELNKFVSYTNISDSLIELVVAAYHIAFPEGAAFGFVEGYLSGVEEESMLAVDIEYDKLSEHAKLLEKQLKKAQKENEILKRALQKIKTKQVQHTSSMENSSLVNSKTIKV